MTTPPQDRATGDGGAAFPCPETARWPAEPGMSLRDYFAAKALAGLVAAHGVGGAAQPSYELAAQEAYLYADAMLSERARREGGR